MIVLQPNSHARFSAGAIMKLVNWGCHDQDQFRCDHLMHFFSQILDTSQLISLH